MAFSGVLLPLLSGYLFSLAGGGGFPDGRQTQTIAFW